MSSGTATLRILSNWCSCCTILQQNSGKTCIILSDWQSHSRAICFSTHHSYHAPSCFSPVHADKEPAELEKLNERPDLNDVMNVVAAKIPSEWEKVSITI